MKGWIYIAANNRILGLVKIGYTERDPDARAKELSVATGVPGNTEIKYMAWVEDVVNIERQLHGKFDATRDPGKEWFETKMADGIDALQTICKPIFEDIRTPLQVVSCTECGKKHRLPPSQLGTVRCKNSECGYKFFASTMSEADSDKRKIKELTDTLDQKLVELAEAKSLIGERNETIDQLESYGGYTTQYVNDLREEFEVANSMIRDLEREKNNWRRS